MDVQSEISSTKGVGPKTALNLNKCGIYTILDLLLYFPRYYETIKNCSKINNADKNPKTIIKCSVVRINKDLRFNSGKVLTSIVFTDGDRQFKGQWFNQPYMKNYYKIGMDYTLIGKITSFRTETILQSPQILKDKVEVNNSNDKVNILPKYSLREGISNNLIIKLIKDVLSKIVIEENLPQWVISKYNFISLDSAIRCIHYPTSSEELEKSTKRLKFQEMFTYSMKILMLKEYMSKNSKGIAFDISKELWKLKEKLPFNLTPSQSKVINEVLAGEKSDKAMNRLIQGDVGSGKTVIALIAAFNAIKNGYQAAIMAPTEILATQHFNEAVKIFDGFNIKIQKLSGSINKKNKLIIKEQLKKGSIDLIIGTHAILQDDVKFYKLGLVITDEQHRFGVLQRKELSSKGEDIDTIVMTATPIPRTLSLYLYGDLEVSTITELPAGRQKIETFYTQKSSQDKVYNFALEEIRSGRQVYIVCPLVDENDALDLSSVTELYAQLKKDYFKNVEIAILHGKMPPKSKDDIMKKFKDGLIKVLVCTTVIEVGVNVPNASLMIVVNAERFGLAQLHQLRGRVGRGKYKSYCYLIAEIKNDLVKNRMEILKNSSDGFYIAEQDLKLRGSGELFGIRQHGDDSLILSDVFEDIHILKAANSDAKVLLSSTNTNDLKIKEEILIKLQKSSKFICFN